MLKKQHKYELLSGVIIVAIIFFDQLLKIWVKTHLLLGETVPVLGNWFNLFFIENEGMAFGISLGQNFGKLMLSILRIVLVIFLCYYLHKQIKKDRMDGLTLTIFCLIIAGALGNIIDCLFYGIIFNESTPVALASLFPAEGGYAPFFYGRVVDMFYVKLFPIPDNFPLWGGSYFFPAVFNVADACITVGIFMVIICNKRFFKLFEKKEEEICSGSTENASNDH